MEDDKLKTLFSDFEPELPSDFLFMNKLQGSLDSVEIVRQHSAEVRSQNKKAVMIAAFVGFIVGFISSLSLPYLSEAVSKWRLTLPDESMMKALADNFTIIAWIMIGSTAVFAALNTYELSLSLFKSRQPCPQRN
ncbi:MAG: hypothetical protein K2I18_06395 [Paramuribaculum sp.]|nr:hypothetical protein [Paramuribaculum sp.]